MEELLKQETIVMFGNLPGVVGGTAPYWYKFYVGECPVCGRDCSFKERQYTPKPDKWEDRYEYLSESFCYCGCVY